MTIKELCRICKIYDANILSLSLESSKLKDSLNNGWSETSIGVQQMERLIKHWENENKTIKEQIKDIDSISFNWL
jgi:hypothetical protein